MNKLVDNDLFRWTLKKKNPDLYFPSYNLRDWRKLTTFCLK